MKSLHLRFFRSDMAKFADSGDLVSAKKSMNTLNFHCEEHARKAASLN